MYPYYYYYFLHAIFAITNIYTGIEGFTNNFKGSLKYLDISGNLLLTGGLHINSQSSYVVFLAIC